MNKMGLTYFLRGVSFFFKEWIFKRSIGGFIGGFSILFVVEEYKIVDSEIERITSIKFNILNHELNMQYGFT